jgi:glycerol-3-phosphate acyltransferase PlsY
MLLAGFGAVLGHMFSPFVRFRGGKGIATTAGAFVAIAPLAVGLTFVVWLTVMLMTRIVSVASLTGAIFLPVCVYVVSRVGWQPYHSAVFAISCAVAAVVVIKHRSNIKRLIAGTEPVLQRHKPENHGTG